MRALLLDLGNVLVAFDHERTLRAIGEAAGVEPSRLREALFGKLERDFDRGLLAPVEFFREAERLAGIGRLPDEIWAPAWRDIFTPLPGPLSLLRRLAVPAALVSNTNALHWEGVLRVAPEVAELGALALSFRLGSVKPEPEIFHAALAMLDAGPEESVYADDRGDLVAAARALGLDAFVVDAPGVLERELLRRRLLTDGNCDATDAVHSREAS